MIALGLGIYLQLGQRNQKISGVPRLPDAGIRLGRVSIISATAEELPPTAESEQSSLRINFWHETEGPGEFERVSFVFPIDGMVGAVRGAIDRASALEGAKDAQGRLAKWLDTARTNQAFHNLATK